MAHDGAGMMTGVFRDRISAERAYECLSHETARNAMTRPFETAAS